VSILDDTYNSNPAGAAEALEALRLEPATHRVVVTPGMVELGPEQFTANRRFGTAIAGVADHLLVVGRTNRRALLSGVAARPDSTVQVLRVDHREQAVAWVREHLGPGDAVLYENDLPDHYP
jgi:UDP-N-acetylmuramoyl-tripeptide--D-alanyl-D-alanine ligase